MKKRRIKPSRILARVKRLELERQLYAGSRLPLFKSPYDMTIEEIEKAEQFYKKNR